MPSPVGEGGPLRRWMRGSPLALINGFLICTLSINIKKYFLKQGSFSKNPIVCKNFVPLIRHTRYIQFISLGDFRVCHLPLNGKAHICAISLVICVLKLPHKSKFEIILTRFK